MVLLLICEGKMVLKKKSYTNKMSNLELIDLKHCMEIDLTDLNI